jgi:hypothetical protein
VVIVPGGTEAVAPVFAQQDSMLRRMVADMDRLMSMPMPDPQQMIRSVMSGMPPGSGVVTTFFSNGSQTCSQTITYGSAANGGPPVVRVSSSGNGCGVVRPSGPISVARPAPAPQPVTPPHEKLWTIGYPPHAVPVHVPPRT